MYASSLITFKPFLRSGVHNLQIPNFFLLFKNVKSSVILFGSGHEKQVIIGNWLNIIHVVHSYLHNKFCKPWLWKWNVLCVRHPLVSINDDLLHQGCIMLLCGSVETFKFELTWSSSHSSCSPTSGNSCIMSPAALQEWSVMMSPGVISAWGSMTTHSKQKACVQSGGLEFERPGCLSVRDGLTKKHYWSHYVKPGVNNDSKKSSV